MDKMDKIQDARVLQEEVARSLKLERFLVTPAPSQEDLSSRCRDWLFGQLKNELSSRLATLEAIFVASNVMEDVDVIKDLVLFLSDVSSECQAFIEQYASFDDGEEGGVENA